MSDIILAGVSLVKLKKQKQAIQKDAAAFIADGIKEATAIIKGIVEAAEDSDLDDGAIQAAAKKAEEILDNVALVSGVSGVTYYLPFYEEWGYADERPYTSQLADVGLVNYRNGDAVYSLYSTLEDMQSTSKNWHSSRC